ncbi:MAG: lipid A deacylase LpxR family protein [Bacteroidetes bacterium]|nr:lipid A deacylase LpxR family protein [Bacteroidota bacterium]
MRFYIIILLLACLVACSSDGQKAYNKEKREKHYKVIEPERLRTMISQSRSAISIQNKKKQSHKPEKIVIVTPQRPAEPTGLNKLESLKASGIKPDASEPLNKDLLLGKGSDTLFNSAITLSPDRVLRIVFDNDIFDYTDQFYTNGIRFEYVAPAISDNPVKHILLPYWAKAKNYYGVSLVQNLYTPSTTKTGGIIYGDRPYSAYLYFGSFKITNDDLHHFRQTSELDLGVIGPPSLGGTVQDLFHKYVPYNNEPLGWEYQISTDAVINYNFSMEKGVINTRHLQLILTGSGALGTLYVNCGGGMNLRLGWFNDYFSDLGIRKKRVLKAGGSRVAQYYFTIKGAARLVAYDATLEGGMLNHNSSYTIPASSLSNIVTQTSLGFTMSLGGIGLEIEQNVLSPEFSHKWWHAWGHIGLFFAL